MLACRTLALPLRSAIEQEGRSTLIARADPPRRAALACRQPSDFAAPTVFGSDVPWIARRSPPSQSVGTLGWWPDRARAQQPYGVDPVIRSRSVTPKRC